MEIRITQDIRKFKTKDIGAFSFKEAGFLALAAGAGGITYKLTASLELAFVPVAIILIIGFFKPLGLSFFQFVRTVLKENLFTPKTYIWQTDFEYEPDEFEQLYGEKITIPSSWNAIQAEPESQNKKQQKLDKAQLIR